VVGGGVVSAGGAVVAGGGGAVAAVVPGVDGGVGALADGAVGTSGLGAPPPQAAINAAQPRETARVIENVDERMRETSGAAADG
jgi:hypothetical protein